ncbi:MAG: IS1595 family transposase [Alphaproteobacteria bacterium]|jgi:transposase|nr:IS1595 family transposase [Alphaproteobacteria bacterium]MBT4700945.1 IS1595 family transposase [Rhodospirillaceae bacterium]MBT7944319.1 IS1595 family transposase [Alphaproteobacteria bacterium]
MAKTFTIQDFFKRFPDDTACLNHLMATRYGDKITCPKCDKESRFARIKKLPAFSCPTCGHHIHPMAGTPFARSRTPLQKWFYAMYMFTTTRNGVSAKELQRQLGVTYKCAWRMGHEIRKYMTFVDGDSPLGGDKIVEIDETRIGGKDKMGKDDKTIVMGMLERGGDVTTRIVPSVKRKSLMPHILLTVRPGTRVATDELHSYNELEFSGYQHGTVNHSKGQYVKGRVHVNSIEGFWSWLKRGIYGTHVSVSKKHMSKYLGEFEFRFNLRDQPELMFEYLLKAFPRP